MTDKILPAVLSGGAGSRLWPLSRKARPKQFLALLSERSLLQETAGRLSGPAFHAPLFIAGIDHAALIADQLAVLGQTPEAILLEPQGRNTAPAIAAAALFAAERFGSDQLVLAAPADHHIADQDAFRAGVETGARLADAGRIVTFGIEPDGPATGYGYIKAGAPLGADGFAIETFHEKPDLGTARALLAEGGWCWNSGVFLFKAGALIREMAALAPDILEPVRTALGKAERDGIAACLEPSAFAHATPAPFDTAVMEKTRQGAMTPIACGWDDVGAFDALWRLSPRDDRDISAGGEAPVIALDCERALIRAEGVAVAAAGLKDVILIATPDAVLAADLRDPQSVRALVEALKAQGRTDLL